MLTQHLAVSTKAAHKKAVNNTLAPAGALQTPTIQGQAYFYCTALTNVDSHVRIHIM
jgi:hypothetical protein